MMPRKKRRTIIIVSIVLIMLIIVASLIMLYINTDLFKSSDTLFVKYIAQNMENIESIYEDAKKSEYNELLENNKYTTETRNKSKLYRKYWDKF